MFKRIWQLVCHDSRPILNPLVLNRSSGLPCTACSARALIFYSNP